MASPESAKADARNGIENWRVWDTAAGEVPVRLEELTLSLDDPDAFVAALTPP